MESTVSKLRRVKEFSIVGKPFAFNSRPALLGVINLSPDSWYRESVCLAVVDSAADRLTRLMHPTESERGSGQSQTVRGQA